MLLSPQETRTFFITTLPANRRRLCFGGERKASQIEYPRRHRHQMPLPLLRWERRALALRKSSIAIRALAPGITTLNFTYVARPAGNSNFLHHYRHRKPTSPIPGRIKRKHLSKRYRAKSLKDPPPDSRFRRNARPYPPPAHTCKKRLSRKSNAIHQRRLLLPTQEQVEGLAG